MAGQQETVFGHRGLQLGLAKVRKQALLEGHSEFFLRSSSIFPHALTPAPGERRQVLWASPGTSWSASAPPQPHSGPTGVSADTCCGQLRRGQLCVSPLRRPSSRQGRNTQGLLERVRAQSCQGVRHTGAALACSVQCGQSTLVKRSHNLVPTRNLLNPLCLSCIYKIYWRKHARVGGGNRSFCR